MNKETIGLVGVGLAGTAFAELLLHGGFDVLGYDIDPVKRHNLVKIGGTAASSAAEIGRTCQRVILSLMTTDIVRQVIEGPGGLLSAAPAFAPAYILRRRHRPLHGAHATSHRSPL